MTGPERLDETPIFRATVEAFRSRPPTGRHRWRDDVDARTQEIPRVIEEPADTGDLVGGEGDPAEVDPVPDDVVDPSHPDYVEPAQGVTRPVLAEPPPAEAPAPVDPALAAETDL